MDSGFSEFSMLSAARSFFPRALFVVESKDNGSASALMKIHRLACCFCPPLLFPSLQVFVLQGNDEVCAGIL